MEKPDKLTNSSQSVQGERFTTNLGILAATLGSAVGLGNIWKFPYLAGTNGGASFILVYLLATILVGLPVMIAEMAIGRRAKADAITSLIRLSPRKSQPNHGGWSGRWASWQPSSSLLFTPRLQPGCLPTFSKRRWG